MAATTEVLYVALDACDREVVRALCAVGELPTLNRFLVHGAVVDTEPPIGAYISANWVSFATGLRPDRHEYLCWVEVDPESYEWREVPPTAAKGTPFWIELARQGRRTCVFDVPHATARPDSDVVQVFEWGCHDRHLGTASVPVDLVTELEAAAGGAHPIGGAPAARELNFAPCDFVHRAGDQRTHPETTALWEDLLLGVDRKLAATTRLLDEGGWSVFGVVFGESHCTGHQLWALHDPTHPRYDPTKVALIGDPIREMYRRLDAALAELLERVDDDTAVYVHLPHGMGPHYDGTHLLDEILHRLYEAGSSSRGWRSRVLQRAIGAVPGDVRRRVMRKLAPQMRAYVDRHPPGPQAPWELPLAERPWFQVPNNAVGAIRLNLQGREPHGVVPADQYDQVCDDLQRWLEEIVNVDSGEPLVHRVRRSDHVYRRTRDDRLPDLFVEWNSNAPIERVYSPRIGTVIGADSHWRTGDHRRHGLLLAMGPGIAPGMRRNRIGTEDVGVTLCAAVGVELEGLDGRPVPDLLPRREGDEHPAVSDLDSRRGGEWREPLHVPDRLDRVVTALAAEQRATRRLAEHLDVRGQQMAYRVEVAAADLASHDLRIRELEREASVRAVTDWVREADVPEESKVSIVMPTRDRAATAPRAIESVLAQTYRNIELVVVDDGSQDETPRMLSKIADARLRVLRTTGLGVCAARNVGLDAVTGDYVVYLDDDNLMTPWWCKAVVWAFRQRPEFDVLYGARLIDDIVRARGEGEGSMPTIQFEPYDFERLTEHNFADMNVIAHRAGLAEARFDESTSTYGDWDLLWRLTRHSPPLELPVLACHYETQGTDRLSAAGGDEHDRDAVRAKFARLLEQGQ